jgi:hypothetical protein
MYSRRPIHVRVADKVCGPLCSVFLRCGVHIIKSKCNLLVHGITLIKNVFVRVTMVSDKMAPLDNHVRLSAITNNKAVDQCRMPGWLPFLTHIYTVVYRVLLSSTSFTCLSSTHSPLPKLRHLLLQNRLSVNRPWTVSQYLFDKMHVASSLSTICLRSIQCQRTSRSSSLSKTEFALHNHCVLLCYAPQYSRFLL